MRVKAIGGLYPAGDLKKGDIHSQRETVKIYTGDTRSLIGRLMTECTNGGARSEKDVTQSAALKSTG